MDRNGSRSHLMVNFGISSVEPSGTAIRTL